MKKLQMQKEKVTKGKAKRKNGKWKHIQMGAGVCV